MKRKNLINFIFPNHMNNNCANLPHSQLIELLQIAKDATPGPWQAIPCGIKYIHEVQCSQMIASCMKNGLVFKRAPDSHIYLVETLGKNAKFNAIYIGNFHPKLAKLLIKELLSLGDIIRKIYSTFDAFQLAKINPDLEQGIHDALETNTHRSNLAELLKNAEAATPGPWRAPVGGEHDDLVRTSWKWPRNRCLRDKDGKRILKSQDMNWKNCAFKIAIDGRIYLSESQENQHIANATYIANLHPGVAISLIEKIIGFRKIISKLFELVSHTQVAALEEA